MCRDMNKETKPLRPALPDDLSFLRPDELLTLALRRLYERHGYRQFRMTRFENYDFYQGYRDFLASPQVLTFTDLDGTLMALRPDVTLSIVKKAGGLPCERLYYTEPVFRPARGAAGFRESFQVGVEYIGTVTPYATLEMVLLAARSLRLLTDRPVLDIAHTEYLDGLLDAVPVSSERKERLRACIVSKNAHGITDAAGSAVGAEALGRLQAVAQLSGPLGQTLTRARALAAGDRMHGAVDALDALFQSLSHTEEAPLFRLDFSISSDAKYYRGLVMRGYVSGAPGAVLSGGRYDPLLSRMEKPHAQAMGFAIYFDELLRLMDAPAARGVDVALAYPAGMDPLRVAEAVRAQTDAGHSVFAATDDTAFPAYGRRMEVLDDA